AQRRVTRRAPRGPDCTRRLRLPGVADALAGDSARPGRSARSRSYPGRIGKVSAHRPDHGRAARQPLRPKAWSTGMMNRLALAILGAVTLTASPAPAAAQVKTDTPPVVPGAAKVRVDQIKVFSLSVAGNLEGNPADREVFVLLPPS